MPKSDFKPLFKADKGLSEALVGKISDLKKEPAFMRRFRLLAYDIFLKKKMPAFGPPLKDFDFNDLYYYLKPLSSIAKSWEDLPREIRTTYEKLGIPKAERELLLGAVSAQYESEVVYQSLQKSLRQKGVIFLDMDSAVCKYPQLVKKYFATVIPPSDNKFAALNSAFWSGGTFIYVPPRVKIDLPLQAFFRIDAYKLGQFERTLIIADSESSLHYIEGCTAPAYSKNALHSGVVEIIVKKKARVRYTTVQNWSKNVFNLVTKRMFVEEGGFGEWVDGNIGSGKTMKYPAIYLKGKGAKGKVLSLSLAGRDQYQDSGARIIHEAGDTSSQVMAKSLCRDGGRTSFRGLARIKKKARGVKTRMVCEGLILDDRSQTDSYPKIEVNGEEVEVEHEASVSRIRTEQLFYLKSRGLTEKEAQGMIINGFIDPIVKEIPFEYAIELNRLIGLQMEGAVI